MMLVQKKDVQLDKQRFKIVMKKGQNHNEEYRTIKTIALPLWKEVMEEASDDQYLFSVGLAPGDKSIRPDQITKRWYRLVKKKLGVTADFYSLKHSNLDEISEALNLLEAQKMAGHSTPVITLGYTAGEWERKHKKLKGVDNAFA